MYSHRFQQIPVAENIGWRGVNLPSWPDISDDALAYIVEHIKTFFKK
jgi:perosamine synthetase